MNLRVMSLVFIVIAVTGCSSTEMKPVENTQVVMLSIEDSVAEVDMSEFAYRNY